jgi:hypothetical protein
MSSPPWPTSAPNSATPRCRRSSFTCRPAMRRPVAPSRCAARFFVTCVRLTAGLLFYLPSNVFCAVNRVDGMVSRKHPCRLQQEYAAVVKTFREGAGMERVLVNPLQNATLYRTSLNQALRPGPHRQAIRVPATAGAATLGDFSRIPAHSQSTHETGNRSNLKIGSANDPLEQEADRIAEQVIGMPHPKFAVTSAPAQLHRKCAQCEQEDEGEHKLHRKPLAASHAIAGDAPASVHQVLRSPGRPLESSAQNFFEPIRLRFAIDSRAHGCCSSALCSRRRRCRLCRRTPYCVC